MDFIFMLTRNDRTIEDAESVVDAACDLGVRHIGFKDVGVSARHDAGDRAGDPPARRRFVSRGCEYNTGGRRPVAGSGARARRRSYPRRHRSCARPRASWATSAGYFPFPGRPVGHPTRLYGSAALVAEHTRAAKASGCGGVDLLAYRATEADPLDLVRAARDALARRPADRRRQRQFGAADPRARRRRRRRLHDRFGGVRRLVLAVQGRVSRADPGHPRRLRQGAADGGMKPVSAPRDRVSARCRSARLLAARGSTPTTACRSACRSSRSRSSGAWPGSRRTSSVRCRWDERLRSSATPSTERVLGARDRARARVASATVTPVVLDGAPHADASTVQRVRTRVRNRRRAGGRRLGNDQRLVQVCGREGRQAVRGVRDRTVDERLHVDERGDHRRRPQEDAAGGSAARRVHRSGGVRRGTGTHDPRRPRRLALPLDGAGRLAAVAAPVATRAYREAPFALLAADEPALLDAPEALFGGDLDAMGALARTLVLSGFGMTICHGSYPASQGEHLISHYIDMFAPADRPRVLLTASRSAVATLTMARLQEAMIDGPAAARRGGVDHPGGIAAPVRRRARRFLLERIRGQAPAGAHGGRAFGANRG